MNTLRLALDWTPNINHIGFFVAQEKAFYNNLGLTVKILNPAEDQYQTTPAKKVELQQADLALCPTESVISYRTKKEPFNLIAIASLLQEDISAIAVKKNSGIDSPRDLDSKIYSSYQARYEDGIVREMIKNDGGKGDLEITYPNKLGIWDTLLNGKADATWIFLNWEGVEVGDSPADLTYFKLSDYQIPYSYSPVIVANEDALNRELQQYQNFIEATKKGFLYAINHPKESSEILQKYVPPYDQKIDLLKALNYSAPYFGNKKTWGKIDHEKIDAFLKWLQTKELETKEILGNQIFTPKCM